MILNSRRSSWITRWFRDRPLHSTSCPQVEDALHSSSCFRVHHSRDHRVLRRPLPLLPQSQQRRQGKGMGKGKGKSKNNGYGGIGNNNSDNSRGPRRGPPSTIPRLAPSRCDQGCVLHSSSQCIHHNTPCSLHWHTMGLSAVPPSRPYQLLHRTSIKT
jgi:hypothetical protein